MVILVFGCLTTVANRNNLAADENKPRASNELHQTKNKQDEAFQIGDCVVVISLDRKRCDIRQITGHVVHSTKTRRLKTGLIRWLSNFPEMEEVRIIGLYMDVDALEAIDEIHQLKRFYAYRTNFSDVHAQALVKCKQLTTISIQEWSQLTDQSIITFARLQNLKILNLIDLPFVPLDSEEQLAQFLPKTKVTVYHEGFSDKSTNPSENKSGGQ